MNELIFQHAPDGWLLLAGLTALALLGALVVARKSHETRPEPAPRPEYVPIEPAELQPAPLRIPDAPDSDEALGYEVAAVDALTEVDVFINFGYLENAAIALRHYIDQYAPHSGQQLRRLGELYLQLGQIHDYSDTLERRHDLALLDREQLESAVLDGLRQDYNNLNLRVLAEQRLGWGVEEIRRLLGDQLPPGMTLEDAPAGRQPDLPPALVPAGAAGAPLNPVPLLEGYRPLGALAAEEREVVAALLPAEKQARILLACRAHEQALPVLERILQLKPGSLLHRLDALCIHYQARDLDAFARTLWHFHMTLGPYGQRLKEQLLHAGLVIGAHPVLAALAGNPDRLALEVIGREAGYERHAPPPARRLELVERVTGETVPQGNDPLAEADHYLQFGQVDMAMRTLEQAILARPQDPQPYPLLLELYERQDELRRFTWLTRKLKESASPIPDEIIISMSGFLQRLQQRPQRALAA